MSLWVSLSGNTEFYILLRWHCCPWAFVKCRSGCGLLTLIENDWKHCVESFIKSCRHAAPCLTEADLLWMVVHWKTVHYVLDSEVENRSLHVLSTAQAGAESSVTAWSTWLCGWLVCFGGGLVRGHGHHTPDVWWRWLDGVIVLCLCFLFLFFFNSSTVVSTCAQYLYQKTGLMSCSLPVLGGMKFCLFFFFFCLQSFDWLTYFKIYQKYLLK